MSPAMPEPRPARKAGGRLWPPQPRGRRAAPHLAAARGPDAAAAAAAMALSNPCPSARSSAAIPPTRAATRRSRAASPDPPRSRARAAGGGTRARREQGRARREQGRARREAGRAGSRLPLSLSAACRLSAKRDLKGFACQLPEFHTWAVALSRGKAALSLIFFFFLREFTR